ncbi:unnamed protein product, partial [Tetraodon nigroviridis]
PGPLLSQRGLSCYHRRASGSWALIGQAEWRSQLSLPICQRGDDDGHRQGRFHRSNTRKAEIVMAAQDAVQARHCAELFVALHIRMQIIPDSGFAYFASCDDTVVTLWPMVCFARLDFNSWLELRAEVPATLHAFIIRSICQDNEAYLLLPFLTLALKAT